MSYTLNKSNGSTLITLGDQTINTSACSLTLKGRGVLNYGKGDAENLIHLLENAANSTPPINPLVGQQWYDTSTNKMKVWNGTAWVRVLLGTDDNNLIPGLTFGARLTLTGSTLSSNVRSVASRTGDVVLSVSDVTGAAPLNSPALVGTPTAPTAATGTNSTQLATTAFVRAQITQQVNNYGAGYGLQVDGNNNLRAVGTANRIDVGSAGIDISAAYVGQSSIVTLGNIATGTWNADTIGISRGGTGATTADQARTNLSAMKYNALANSLGTAGNGILSNNNGVATARQIVSGSSGISVTNGDGISGDITISLINENQSDPTPITLGGTGASTKTNALNNLSPATSEGDMLYYHSGAHVRLASPGTDPSTYALLSGAGNADPRWSSSIPATLLGGHDGTFYLNRANHTGTNNADQLGGQPPSYYLSYANMTGTLPSPALVTASNYSTTGGYVKFSNTIQMCWGTYTCPANATLTITFPVAFTTSCFFGVVNGISEYDTGAEHNWPTVVNQNKNSMIVFASTNHTTNGSYFAIGI